MSVSPFPGRSLEPFDVFTPAQWHGKPVPAQDWIVGGLIAAGTVSMISGDGGLGKSLLVQQLMTAAALGQEWLGFPVKTCRVLGIFCEDPVHELQRRQAAINEHYGCEMLDLGENITMQCRISRESYLCGFDRWEDTIKHTPFFSQIEHFIREHGIQVLVLDTVRKVFGGNEIRDRQVARFIALLRSLAIRMQGCVILTAHPSNEGVSSGSGLAGSRAWRNEVRSMMYLTNSKKDEQKDHRVLVTKKANYAQSGGKLDLVWERGVFRRPDQPTIKDYSEPTSEPPLLPGW